MKRIEERVRAKWSGIQCAFETLKTVLETEDILELWVEYAGVYFQLGVSGEYRRGQGFSDKVFYINLKTDEDITALLNGKPNNEWFFMSADFDALSEMRVINGRALREIWEQAVVVGVDEADPKRFPPLAKR